MSAFPLFLVSAFFISFSGAMAPGPMTVATIGKGSQSPSAGFWIAIGHGMVELPLMILLALGVSQFLSNTYLKIGLGLAGGGFLLWMAFQLLPFIRRPPAAKSSASSTPIASGLLLSLGNPYFFVWWATAGAALIFQSLAFGWMGFIALFLAHWSCDCLWSSLLSLLAFRGGKTFGRGFQNTLFMLCALLLFFFGGKLIWDAAATFWI